MLRPDKKNCRPAYAQAGSQKRQPRPTYTKKPPRVGVAFST